jgi:hypothetical protein
MFAICGLFLPLKSNPVLVDKNNLKKGKKSCQFVKDTVVL